ncbi:MAG: hypothetical protein H5T69_11730 [Chloroflexi bacterium]|nr:hypothetical protein [Chloroflexota bacterium]
MEHIGGSGRGQGPQDVIGQARGCADIGQRPATHRAPRKVLLYITALPGIQRAI